MRIRARVLKNRSKFMINLRSHESRRGWNIQIHHTCDVADRACISASRHIVDHETKYEFMKYILIPFFNFFLIKCTHLQLNFFSSMKSFGILSFDWESLTPQSDHECWVLSLFSLLSSFDLKFCIFHSGALYYLNRSPTLNVLSQPCFPLEPVALNRFSRIFRTHWNQWLGSQIKVS